MSLCLIPECLRPVRTSTNGLTNLQDSDKASCVTLQKPSGGHTVFTTFNDTYECSTSLNGVMQLEVILNDEEQCNKLIDLFYMYEETNECNGKPYVKACDLASPNTDVTACRLNCTCRGQCYGAIIVSPFNNFGSLNICSVCVI